jgi:hypothetical protein
MGFTISSPSLLGASAPPLNTMYRRFVTIAPVESLGSECAVSGLWRTRPCNTDPMPEFSVHAGSEIPDAEVIALYESVGWSAYTQEPEVLVQAIQGSTFVVTCRGSAGRLVGLARAISDDATICYVQDILVNPSFQRSGAGPAPVGRCLRPSSPDTAMSGRRYSSPITNPGSTPSMRLWDSWKARTSALSR